MAQADIMRAGFSQTFRVPAKTKPKNIKVDLSWKKGWSWYHLWSKKNQHIMYGPHAKKI